MLCERAGGNRGYLSRRTHRLQQRDVSEDGGGSGLKEHGLSDQLTKLTGQGRLKLSLAPSNETAIIKRQVWGVKRAGGAGRAVEWPRRWPIVGSRT